MAEKTEQKDTTAAIMEKISSIGREQHETYEVQDVRKDFPKELYGRLGVFFGDIKWTDTEMATLIVDRMHGKDMVDGTEVSLIEMLESDPQIEGVMEFGNGGAVFYINGIQYTVMAREDGREYHRENADQVFIKNLKLLKKKLPKDARVVYFGSGNDPLVKDVFGDQAVNMDISGDFLDEGDVRADARDMPLPENSVDMIVTSNTAYVLQDPQLVEAFVKMLKPNGVFFYPQIVDRAGRDLIAEPLVGDREATDEDRRAALNERRNTKCAIDRVFLKDERFKFEDDQKVELDQRNVMTLLRIRK